MTSTLRVTTAIEGGADTFSPDETNSNPAPSAKATAAHQGDAPSAVLVDSPNAMRCVNATYGPQARPDWQAFLHLARSRGNPVRGILAANDGLPRRFVRSFQRMGYLVQFSHAWDVDDRIAAQAIRMVNRARLFVLVSGDGGFCSLVTVLQRLGKRVMVVAVESCCHPNLRTIADEFVPMPVLVPQIPLPNVSPEVLDDRPHSL